MVYVHYTQDAAYLQRFAPCIRSMFSIEPTHIPDDLADDLSFIEGRNDDPDGPVLRVSVYAHKTTFCGLIYVSARASAVR